MKALILIRLGGCCGVWGHKRYASTVRQFGSLVDDHEEKKQENQP